MEPEKNLANTAILILNKRKTYATAARSNRPSLLRRSTRVWNVVVAQIRSTLPKTITLQNDKYAEAMKLLDEHLAVEIRADSYMNEIGFVS